MKNQMILIASLIFFVQITFGQSEKVLLKAERYTTKNFDVAIFPYNCNNLLFEHSHRFTPTKEEIDQAELALRNHLKKLNHKKENQYNSPIIHKKLKKYKKQYFGYINEHGEKILLINCFWAINQKKQPDEWLKHLIVVFDGGSYYWSIKFNLSKKELFGLSVNGSS